MFDTHDDEIPYLLANSLHVKVACSLRMASLISSGMASHRRLILGLGSWKRLTGPNIFSIDSLVNRNCLSMLILFAGEDGV